MDNVTALHGEGIGTMTRNQNLNLDLTSRVSLVVLGTMYRPNPGTVILGAMEFWLHLNNIGP